MQCQENKIWSAISDYICKLKIHIAERQNLEDTVLSLREKLRPRTPIITQISGKPSDA